MLLTKYKQYFDFFGGTVNIPAIVVISVGGIIFVIGFFGCCGAYKENHCMMSTVSG
jgi:CD63 antigen